MALVRRSFRERYEELMAHQPTLTERIHTVCRDEVAGRREVQAHEKADFADMLHVAAVWIAEKKAREKGLGPQMDRHALTLYKRQTAIWFPASPPRMPKGSWTGFPKAKASALFEEEAELRRWHVVIEAKLREHIEHACQESHYIEKCLERLHGHELRGRTRLEREEDDGFKAIRRGLFRAAPPDFYRAKVVARYGATERSRTPTPRELTFEKQEAAARDKIAQEEETSRRGAHQYLVDCYGQLLFQLHCREISHREALEQSQTNAYYPLLVHRCREDFGMCYYHTPAVFLHLRSADSAHSYMSQLCQWHLTEAVCSAHGNRHRQCSRASSQSTPAQPAVPTACPDSAEKKNESFPHTAKETSVAAVAGKEDGVEGAAVEVETQDIEGSADLTRPRTPSPEMDDATPSQREPTAPEESAMDGGALSGLDAEAVAAHIAANKVNGSGGDSKGDDTESPDEKSAGASDQSQTLNEEAVAHK